MSILETIKKRRSIRAFLAKQVEEAKLQSILEAGLWAPSAGNIQAWKFIVVRDTKKKEEITKAAFNQDWLLGTPVIIVVCAEIERLKNYYGVRGERLYAVQECAAAVQNILLEAEAQGLASCWVGAFDEEELRRVLDIPDKSRPQAIIALGYAGEKIPTPAKKSLHATVYFEQYGKATLPKKEIFPLKDTLSNTSTQITEKLKEKTQTLKEKAQDLKERVQQKLLKK